ncbi:hypothetical protein HOD88_00945 [archaeon]|jgi:hypothetical protein|nr:hypothetical protein [archaeon]
MMPEYLVEDAVRKIDPSLEFVGPYMGSHREAVVTRKGESGLFAIKYARSENRVKRQAILREMRALESAGKIEGINPLEQSYQEINGYHAILRKIMPGATTVEDGRTVLDQSQIRTLERTIIELHNRKVVNHGIVAGNVLPSPTGEVRIANSSTWMGPGYYGKDTFEGKIRSDLRALIGLGLGRR